MSKKLLTLLMIICVICSSVFVFTACSGKKDSKDKSGDQNEVVDPEDVIKSVRPPEDFVFEGIWIDEKNEDITMEVTETGDDEYDITIFHGSSAEKSTEWDFSGKFDREGGILSYEDCMRTEHVFDDEGNDKATTVYKNGKGAILYLNEGLYWDDKEENQGKDCVFSWLGDTVDG